MVVIIAGSNTTTTTTTTTNDGNVLIAKVDNKIYDTKRTAIGRIVIDPSG